MIWLTREDDGSRIMINLNRVSVIQHGTNDGSYIHLGDDWTYFVEVQESPREIEQLMMPPQANSQEEA